MLSIEIEVPDIPFEKGVRRWLYNTMRKIRMALKDATPIDSGEARRSWTIVQRIEGGYSFGNTAVYSHILETGSVPGQRPWPSVGPRTTEYMGKIYSSQAPGGMIKTADIDGLIAKAVKELEGKFK